MSASIQNGTNLHQCSNCGKWYDPYQTGSFYFCSDECGQAGLDEASAALRRPPPSPDPEESDFDPDLPVDFS